jgi:hypothetical protein
MSLHGTSESLDFSELLELLAERSKTGTLRMHHQGADVQLYFDGGQLCETGSAAGDHHGDRRSGVPPGLTQTCCEVLQWTHFTFDFEPAAELARPVLSRVPVANVLAAARAELAEWQAIESVIPSLDGRVRPVPELSDDAVVILNSEQWKLLIAMNGTRTVEGLIRSVQGTRLETCRQLRELIDRGLAELVAPPARPTTRIDTAPLGASAGLTFSSEDGSEVPDSEAQPS